MYYIKLKNNSDDYSDKYLQIKTDSDDDLAKNLTMYDGVILMGSVLMLKISTILKYFQNESIN